MLPSTKTNSIPKLYFQLTLTLPHHLVLIKTNSVLGYPVYIWHWFLEGRGKVLLYIWGVRYYFICGVFIGVFIMGWAVLCIRVYKGAISGVFNMGNIFIYE